MLKEKERYTAAVLGKTIKKRQKELLMKDCVDPRMKLRHFTTIIPEAKERVTSNK